MNKSEIRKKILNIRKKNTSLNFSINFKEIMIFLKKEKIKGRLVGGYYPYNYELDIMQILEKFQKKNYLISLPKIKKNFDMDFFDWKFDDPLRVNEYGIPEPFSNRVRFPDILLVPLVAFDKNFNRIGYGGGFYDRYINKIKKRKKIITIGFAYSFQKVKEISTNKYDIKLDHIITEKN